MLGVRLYSYYHHYNLNCAVGTEEALLVVPLYRRICNENLIKYILNRKPFNQTNKIWLYIYTYIGTSESHRELWYPMVISNTPFSILLQFYNCLHSVVVLIFLRISGYVVSNIILVYTIIIYLRK